MLLEAEVWDHNNEDGNITLTDNINETYMTATDDNTQYFSVLETTDLNDTLENNVLFENAYEEDTSENVEKNQVVLYKIDDSEDLYGIQVAHDAEGNLQKYQFKVR